MSVDIDIIKARANNEYRLSKVRGEAMISVGIPCGVLDKVNAALEPFIREIEMELCDVQVDDPKAGYLAIGGRNIVACQRANTDTTGLSRRLEKLIYPSAYHLKTVIAGCPNDCAKASMSDFGIIGVARM
ncbi:sulfite reductase subunit C, partial [Escherichia marmotae]|nr:sulfite reductase subunit C [Escherichia marmotae]